MLVNLCAKGIRNRCLEVICSDAQHIDFGATKKIIDRRIYLFQAASLQVRLKVEHGTRWRHEEITANQDPLQDAARRAFEFYIGIDRATGAGIASGQNLLI